MEEQDLTEIGFPGQRPAEQSADAESGDENPRALLVRRHASAVLAVCLANTKRSHDAEDLMQETFVKAFARFDSLRDPDKARPWLVQIARRLCVDHLRTRKPTSPITDDLPAPAEALDPRIEQLDAALARLPEDFRETIMLYYLDGRSCAGVAATLGISEGAVRMRLLRGRVMLYDLLTGDER
jgi:RNA polymerase sigma-70 factor (ECF subfamily)